MMKKLIIMFLLCSGMTIAQQGINYKAIISNDGTVIQNQQVAVSFTILEDGITIVYKELHVLNTDINGLIITNIGEGVTTIGDFATLDWSNEQFLKVEVDTGSGNVDLGTTAFKNVPYALHAKTSSDKTFVTSNNVTSNSVGDLDNDDFVFGDTQLDGVGKKMFFDKSKAAFRVGQANSDNWDEINLGEYSFAIGTGVKASGLSSVAMGEENSATGDYSTVMGTQSHAVGYSSMVFGRLSAAIGDESIAIGNSNYSSGLGTITLGFSNRAYGEYSLALGWGSETYGERSIGLGHQTYTYGYSSLATGYVSVAYGDVSSTMGYSNYTESYAQTSLGMNSTIVSGTVDSYVATDRLFVVGNGSSQSNRSDAMVVLKNGNTTINGELNVNEVHDDDSGDADMKAYIYGLVTGSNGVIKPASSDGFTVTRNSTGSYSVVFNNAPSSYQDYMVVSSIHGSIGFIKTVRNTTHIAVNTYNTAGVLTDSDFNFVVYKK